MTTATPFGLQHLVERVGDLRGHLFLDLQPLGIDVDEPRQFRDADDAVVRQIGDMHLADDRRDVVLAMRLEADVLQQDDLVIAVGLLEGALQQRHRVLVVAAEIFAVGAHTRSGVPSSPSRSGSSPAQRSKVRTASSASARLGSATADGRDCGSGTDRGECENARHRLLSFSVGRVGQRFARGARAGQLSRTGWCGLSSEKAGMRTENSSPPRRFHLVAADHDARRRRQRRAAGIFKAFARVRAPAARRRRRDRALPAPGRGRR